MDKSKVFFIPVENGRDRERTAYLLKILIKESRLLEEIERNSLVAIKLTFGEKENQGYIKPQLVKVVVDKLKAKGAKPFLTDTNVIYKGKRMNAVDHLETAYLHGFTYENVRCPIFIGDGLLGENSKEIEIDKKHIKKAYIAHFLYYVDQMIVLSHFTGHLFTGFASTLKNIGMGLATRKGKLQQHSNVKPKVIEKNCRLCLLCIKVCPVQAIERRESSSFIREELCIGCGECLVACKFNAIEVSYSEDVNVLGEKIVEYTYAVLKGLKRKIFFNFLLQITKECDCLAKSEPPVIPDMGIFVSLDPVAIDKAGVDMISKKVGRDIFKVLHAQSADVDRQLNYAQEMGLGSLDYQLIKIEP
ncbi:MAG: DUF362 domain-containing protein [Candidatus Omnitrophica bacterium]|nr:DUF362 domain-containing protein [Candidatus Omnitrophota bacterium]